MSEVTALPWVIELRSSHFPHPLKLQIDQQVVLGRSDDAANVHPDVDLGPYGAAENGVSRRHLAIRREADWLSLVDLNSGNGTMFNGERMQSNKPYPLRGEATIQLGQLPLSVHTIISPSTGSEVFKQPGVRIEKNMPMGNGQPVLIVEDDNEVATVLGAMLERSGYLPLICREVVSAIRLFNQRQPSAILLDLMLPDISGIEFCRYVRRDVQRNNVPILVLSAARTRENINHALEAGADIFLSKPVGLLELRAVVTSLIYQRESGVVSLQTKQLAGTAPLSSMEPEKRRNAAVLFVAGHEDAPLVVNVFHQLSFGRSANLPSKQHIDLTRYDAIENGISRVHMTLHAKEGKFYVEDNDSINGTYLNGDPIDPRKMIALKNADEIRLGRLRMYIYFLEDEQR